MGIDGIGKKPPVGQGALDGVTGAKKTGATFDVGATEGAQGAAGAQGVDPASPLGRLRAGEIDVNAYADLKVDEATKHLAAMPASDLADIKSLLREKLVSDPSLVDLVQQSTGHTPAVPED